MPLKLVQRKGSDCWYMRGTIRGESIFETTGTGDRRKAEEIRAKTEARLLDESIHGKKHTVTFAEAADGFIAAGGAKRFLYEQRPNGEAFGVAVVLGQYRLAEITQEVLDRAAARMYPTAQPETKLRQFYTPFRAVWNFAATEKLAEVRKWRLPKKPKGTNVVRIKKQHAKRAARIGRSIYADAFAAGRLAGIREAAEVAWLQSKQGATHEQIRSAVLALAEGKDG